MGPDALARPGKRKRTGDGVGEQAMRAGALRMLNHVGGPAAEKQGPNGAVREGRRELPRLDSNQ